MWGLSCHNILSFDHILPLATFQIELQELLASLTVNLDNRNSEFVTTQDFFISLLHSALTTVTLS